MYDNDDQAFKPRSERYSRLKHSINSTNPTPVSSPKGTVITNSEAETYDTVVTTQDNPQDDQQDVYDNDPFEKDENQVIIRRNSNPNIYSEVNTPKLSRPATSLIVTNPATVLMKPKTSASKPKSPPPPSQPPPSKTDEDSNSGEEYEDMSQSLSISSLLTGNASAKPTDSSKPQIDNFKSKSSEDPPKPYFEFTDEYDTIINETRLEIQAAKQPKAETELAKSEIEPAKSEIEPAKSETEPAKSETEPAKSETEPAKSDNYLLFSEEYDTIIQTTQEEMESTKEEARPDKKGAESQELESYNIMDSMTLSGEALINSQT